MSLLTLAVVSASSVRGQQISAIPNNIRAAYTMEGLSDLNALGNGEVLYGVPMPPGKVIGDTYLSTTWRKSAILLYKDEKLVEGYDVRYDIHADALDVKTSKGVKVLDGKRIRSFTWTDSSRLEPAFFVNAHEYKLDGSPLTGFFEVLVDGQAPLFKRTDIHIKKANYNVSFDVGSRDDKILKQPTYFMGQSGAVNEIESSRKKVLVLFGDKADEMGRYMDVNKLSLKKEGDLVNIFRHYNSLLLQ
jgi:hypothetical protein